MTRQISGMRGKTHLNSIGRNLHIHVHSHREKGDGSKIPTLPLTSLWLSSGEFQSLLSFLNAGWAVSIRLYTVPVAALVTDLMEARVRLSLSSSSVPTSSSLHRAERVVDYNGEETSLSVWKSKIFIAKTFHISPSNVAHCNVYGDISSAT